MNVESFLLEPDRVKAFIELSWRLHAGDPQWIPPFRAELERLLSPANPFFSYGRMRNFVAMDGGRPVARCSAIINRRMSHGGKPIGQLGFYESEPRADASAAVLDAAMAWLKEQKLDQVFGPMNFSIWHSYRFMTRGFERDPFAGEPRNPPHYPEHFQALGFSPVARFFTWDLTEEPLRRLQAAARAMGNPAALGEAGLHLRHLRLDAFDQELVHVYRLLVGAFSDSVGYTHVELDEFLPLYGGAKAILVPELVPLLWTADERAVGIGYLFPDYAEAIRRMNGSTGLLSKLRFLLAKRSPDRLVMHTVAIEKEYRKKGLIEAVLGDLLEAALARGLTRAVGVLTREGPTLYSKISEPTREYTLFHRAL